jgi:heavy metal translocating P-type ATPase
MSAEPIAIEALQAAGKEPAQLQLAIGGMQCSFCRQSLERALSRLPGVRTVAVNLAHEEALIRYDGAAPTAARVTEALRSLGYTIRDRERLRSFEEAEEELDQERRRLLAAALLSGVGLAMMVPDWLRLPVAGPWLAWSMAAAATVMLVLGRRFFSMAWAAGRHGILNQHVLLSFSVLGAFAAGLIGLVNPAFPAVDFFGAAVFLMAYHTLSSYVGGLVRTRASAAVRRLLELQPATARVIRAGEEIEVPITEIAVGEAVRVRPGERIALDGEVIEGTASADESMVTGEPLPVGKAPGATVIGGSLDTDGMLLIRITKPAAESFVARVAREVETAKALKPALLILVERVLLVYVPTVLIIAVAAFLGWFAFGALAGVSELTRAVFAALTVLVMGYPCALGMATPLALIRGGGEAARRGILVRSAEAFQTLKDVRTIVFDKTGTITQGKPKVLGTPDPQLLAAAASLEQFSRHPLARAIVEAAKARGLSLPDPDTIADFHEAPGRGLSAVTGGARLLVGSPRYLAEEGIVVPEDNLPEAATLVGVARDGRLEGMIPLGDELRPDAKAIIRELSARGLEAILVTGDNRRTAEAVARRVGIQRVHAEALPADKAGYVRSLQEQGLTVAMVGDGINDAPALMQADVGVAFDAGTDIAIESADAVVMNHSLGAIADLLDIGRRSYRKTAQNLGIAFGFNGLGIPLAATGLLQPVWAMIAMAGSVTTVLLNSFGGSLVAARAGADAGALPAVAAGAADPASDTRREQESTGFSIPLIAVASLATFLSNMSAGIVNVPIAGVTGALGGALGGSDYALVAIILSYLVPFAVVMPVIGKLGDRYGHKRLFLLGLSVYAAGSLLAALSPDAGWLIAARTLQGLGGGIILDSIVFISTRIRQDRRGLALGIWRAALLSGTVGGPVIGGYLAVELGWRSLFWLPVPLAALLWLWGLVVLPELPRRDERFDWVGSLAFLVGTSALVIALAASGMETMHVGLTAAIGRTMDSMAWMLYGVAAVAAIVLWIDQKTEKHPLFDVSLYRIRPFVLGNLGTWLVCVGMFCAMMFVPLELQYVAGYSALHATEALVPLALTAIAVGIWGGQITDRMGPVQPWATGFVLMTAGFIGLVVLGASISPAWLFTIMTVTGVGMALPLAPTAVTALTTVPEASAGEAGGLFNFSHNMGRAMGLGILGAFLVLTAAGSYSLIFLITAVLMALGALLTMGLRTQKERS